MTIQPASPSSDERLLAGLAHFFGPAIALIIWATQKDKSRFVRFQAMQAVAFDLFMIVVFVVGFGCFMVLIFGSAVLGTAGSLAVGVDDTGVALAGLFALLGFVVPIAGQCVLLIVVGAFVVARGIAAYNAFQGRDFRYPVLGARVEKWLG